MLMMTMLNRPIKYPSLHKFILNIFCIFSLLLLLVLLFFTFFVPEKTLETNGKIIINYICTGTTTITWNVPQIFVWKHKNCTLNAYNCYCVCELLYFNSLILQKACYIIFDCMKTQHKRMCMFINYDLLVIREEDWK